MLQADRRARGRSHRLLRPCQGWQRDGPATAALLSRGLRQPAGRMIGVELLDDPRADPALVRRALADIARTNRLFGGTHAVIATLERHFRAAPHRPWTLLDIGTGQGDIPLAAAKAARRHGIDLRLVGVERIPAAARIAREQGLAAVLADGGSLPFAPKSVDVVIASQVLHHFPRDTAARWIAAFDRIARRAVVLADLP